MLLTREPSSQPHSFYVSFFFSPHFKMWLTDSPLLHSGTIAVSRPLLPFWLCYCDYYNIYLYFLGFGGWVGRETGFLCVIILLALELSL